MHEGTNVRVQSFKFEKNYFSLTKVWNMAGVSRLIGTRYTWPKMAFAFQKNKQCRGFLRYMSSTRVNEPKDMKIGVQGACLELGQQKTGVADGPKKLRETQFIEVLRDVVGMDIIDYGDVNLTRGLSNSDENMFYSPDETRPVFPRNPPKEQNSIQTHRIWKKTVTANNVKGVGAATAAIADSTEKILKDDRICLTLGGDHSLVIGTLAGTTRVHGEQTGVIWIDAHTDINTPLTTNTGNIHGMALSFHIPQMIPYMIQYKAFSSIRPCVQPNSIVYIGLRDVEPYEKSFLKKFDIKAFSMKEVDLLGINGVIEQTLDYLMPNGALRPIHLSLDVDSVDPHDVPCTGTPVAGGLTLRECMHLLEEMSKNAELVALDCVEFNPSLCYDIAATRTSMAIKELIFSCFQYHRGGILANGELPMPSHYTKDE